MKSLDLSSSINTLQLSITLSVASFRSSTSSLLNISATPLFRISFPWDCSLNTFVQLLTTPVVKTLPKITYFWVLGEVKVAFVPVKQKKKTLIVRLWLLELALFCKSIWTSLNENMVLIIENIVQHDILQTLMWNTHLWNWQSKASLGNPVEHK